MLLDIPAEEKTNKLKFIQILAKIGEHNRILVYGIWCGYMMLHELNDMLHIVRAEYTLYD